MWNQQWPAIGPSIAPMPAQPCIAQPPLPVAPPPTTPAAPLAIAPNVAGVGGGVTAPVVAGSMSSPYGQYTAAQYASLTAEQQYALQQHWQQWQAYQQEYAKWHAQYGEQYKREMAAVTAVSYQPPLPSQPPPIPPTAESVGEPAQVEPVVKPTQSNVKITASATMYNQPPQPTPSTTATNQTGKQENANLPWYAAKNEPNYNQPPPSFQQKTSSNENLQRPQMQPPYNQTNNWGKNGNQSQQGPMQNFNDSNSGNNTNNNNNWVNNGRNERNNRNNSNNRPNNNNNWKGSYNNNSNNNNNNFRGGGRNERWSNNNENNNHNQNRWGNTRNDNDYGNQNRNMNNNNNNNSTNWGQNFNSCDNERNINELPTGQQKQQYPQPQQQQQMAPELTEDFFDRQFRLWEDSFEDWKRTNANNPDRKWYEHYEREFENQRKRLIERRNQMRQRRMGQMSSQQQPQRPQQPIEESMPSSAIKSNEPQSTEESSKQEVDQVKESEYQNKEEEETNAHSSAKMETGNDTAEKEVVENPDKSDDKLESNINEARKRKGNFEEDGFKSKTLRENEHKDDIVIINLDEDEENEDNKKTNDKMMNIFGKSEGIPGLDLVEDHEKQSLIKDTIKNTVEQLESTEIPEEKTEPEKETNKTHNETSSPQVKKPLSQQIQESSVGNLPIVINALRDPEMLQNIIQVLAKVQGLNQKDVGASESEPSEQVLKQLPGLLQKLQDQRQQVPAPVERGNMSFAEWQQRNNNKNNNGENMNEEENRQMMNQMQNFGNNGGPNVRNFGGNMQNFNGPNNNMGGPNFGGPNFGPNFGGRGGGRNFGGGPNFGGPNFRGNGPRPYFDNCGPSNNFNGPQFESNFGRHGGNFNSNADGPHFSGCGPGSNFNTNMGRFGPSFNNSPNSNTVQPSGSDNNNERRLQHSNNPFRRGGGKGARGGFNNRNIPAIGPEKTSAVATAGGDDFFEPVKVIEYENKSTATKVFEYSRRMQPNTILNNERRAMDDEFQPVKTFDYGHASGAMPLEGRRNENVNYTGKNNRGRFGNRNRKNRNKKKKNAANAKVVGENLKNQQQQQQQPEQLTQNEDNDKNNEEKEETTDMLLEEQPIQAESTAEKSNVEEKEEIINENDVENMQTEELMEATKHSEIEELDENKEKSIEKNILNLSAELEEISDTEDTLPDDPIPDRQSSPPPPPPPPIFSLPSISASTLSQSLSLFPAVNATQAIPTVSASPPSIQMLYPSVENNNTITIDEILLPPGRLTRPKKICIILRGPPGSGKSFVAKLIKDKEQEMGGNSIRILSIDDYFLIENDYEEKCPKTGKRLPKKEILYEYDSDMEPTYMQYLIKSFKKTITDNLYDIIVIDCNNNSLRTLNEFYCPAKDSGFVAYIIDLFCDVETCLSRNTHDRSEADIRNIIDTWKATPFHYIKLDVSSLLENVIEMEDAENMAKDDKFDNTMDLTENEKINSIEESAVILTSCTSNEEDSQESESSVSCLQSNLKS